MIITQTSENQTSTRVLSLFYVDVLMNMLMNTIVCLGVGISCRNDEEEHKVATVKLTLIKTVRRSMSLVLSTRMMAVGPAIAA